MNDMRKSNVHNNEMDSDDQFLDKSELAHRLAIHERTVSRMVDRGELPQPCMGHGGRPRWLWSFVLEYCRKRHEQQARRTSSMK